MKEIIIMKKTIVGAAVIAVMATSFSAYAATNFHQGSASNKGTQIVVAGSKQQAQNNTVAKVNKEATKGSLEYSKTTFRSEKDGSTSIEETWLNPNTFDFRDDINKFGVNENDLKIDAASLAKMKKTQADVVKYSSTYNEGKHVVNIIRDDKGNAVRGNEYEVTQKEADSEIQDIQKYRAFAAIKASYTNPSAWKDAGTTTAADGTKLKKISSGDINGDEMHLLYLNEDGLPVKTELYSNGKLTGVGTTEYKLIQDDGKIFDTSAVKLEKLEIK